MASMANWNDEKPLAKVKCRDHDCEKDLHTFLRLRPGGLSYRSEQCSECGANLIEWQRLDRHDLSDVANTVASLQREFIRHQYWHQPIGEKALNYAKRKGLLGLQEAAELRLRKYVGPPRAELFRDGTQTPKVGNAIHYAQHATATCCRKCIEAWHGIERELPLTDQELGYMTELVMHYLKIRLPDLPLEGTKVAGRRSSTSRQPKG
jgi:hypothetical protein